MYLQCIQPLIIWYVYFTRSLFLTGDTAATGSGSLSCALGMSCALFGMS